MNDVTRILNAIDQGDAHAAAELLPLVYDELRRLATQRLAREKPGQTLQATALVNEAYLRLVQRGDRGRVFDAAAEPCETGATDAGASEDSSPGHHRQWDNRGHFFAAAAEAMRRILVENARRKKTLKQGGQLERVPFDDIDVAAPMPSDDLLALDEALTQLAAEKPVIAELVKLRFFAGMTMEEAAQTLGIGPATAYRHWNYARAWLFRAVADKD